MRWGARGGYCLARLWFARRSIREQAVYAFAMSFGLLLAYAALAAVAYGLIRLLA